MRQREGASIGKHTHTHIYIYIYVNQRKKKQERRDQGCICCDKNPALKDFQIMRRVRDGVKRKTKVVGATEPKKKKKSHEGERGESRMVLFLRKKKERERGGILY
jgi:hypothetical protein